MANSNRHNPVIDGKKVCTKCKENKELETSYYFNKSFNCYLGKCSTCIQEENRAKRIPKVGVREGSELYKKQKTCIICGETKIINIENFCRASGNFTKACRVCKDKMRLARKKPPKLGHLPDDATKVCIRCKDEKCILEFTVSNGYYSSYCKKCDSERKINRKANFTPEEYEDYKRIARETYYRNRTTQLVSVYRKFDEDRAMESDITREYVLEQIEKPCTYCNFPSTGLDRLDNSIGHTIENTVPCCRECNLVRNDIFTHEEMLIIGASIAEVKNLRNKN